MPSASRKYLGDGQRRQADAQPRARRLRHLAVDQRGARFRVVLRVDDAAFLELVPEVVALARSFADAAEHRHAAVLERDVVNQLHDDDGLADAGAAEQRRSCRPAGTARAGRWLNDQRDQELLDKQLWGISSRSPQNGMTTLIMRHVFAGLGIGDLCVRRTTRRTTRFSLLIQTGKSNRSSAMIRTAIISVTASFLLFGTGRLISSVPPALNLNSLTPLSAPVDWK